MRFAPQPHCVLVGAGHAAVQCALSLRKNGWSGAITLVGEESALPYHRPPLSKAYLKGEASMDQIALRTSSVYEAHGISLVTGVRVEALDRSARQLELSTRPAIRYDVLVLATGSSPRRPPIPGLDAPGIHVLRTAADCDGLREAARFAKTAVLIGGGFIGLEVASSLRSMGMSIKVLEMDGRLLARVTSPVMSSYFQSLHEAHGVQIHTNVVATNIERVSERLHVVTNGGAGHTADIVILGAGAVPATTLAGASGLHIEDGIVVDEGNRTSDPAIFAIGDCCRQHHPLFGRAVRLESVPNAIDQGKNAASVICGRPAHERPPPWFWSDQYDVKLQMVGLSGGYTDVHIRGEPGKHHSFSAWYFDGARLIAADAVNDPLAYLVAGKLIAKRAEPDKRALANPAADIKTFLTTTKELRYA